MSNAAWLRAALAGRHIRTTYGAASAIVGFGPEGVTLREVGTRVGRTVTMAELHVAIRLWGALGRPPCPEELGTGGVDEANVAHVVPLVAEVRGLAAARSRRPGAAPASLVG